MRVVTFARGVHPPECKELTEQKTIESLPLPSQVIIPLQQHTGAPCQALVAVGDQVKTGQKIGEAEAFISAPVHSSVSGEVISIDTLPHPVGIKTSAVVIKSDGKDEWVELVPHLNWKNLNADELRSIIREAGIVGLGGAAFPTAVKLNPPKGKKIDTFILNGAECEPYLTADYHLMLERGVEIIEGMRILMHILSVNSGFIGVETNKPEAIEKMRNLCAADEEVEVVALRTKYPQGGEKQLIKAILGREVPSGGLPLDVGVVVNNVGTALAVQEAVVNGKPLTERVVTVTGTGVEQPANLRVRVGTSFHNILEYCSGINDDLGKVIMGGPMMGIAQYTLDVPVIKGTSGVLVLSRQEARESQRLPCIRCASCVGHCPMRLVPTVIAKLVEQGHLSEAGNCGLLDCIECGCCSFICPSQIPLVQLLKHGKMQVAIQKRKEAKQEK